MTLRELGEQYLEQERVLRRKLASVRKGADPADLLLQRRIYYLTTEAAECRRIGRYLIHYYEEGGHEQMGAAQRVR